MEFVWVKCFHSKWLTLNFLSQGGRESHHSEVALLMSCCMVSKVVSGMGLFCLIDTQVTENAQQYLDSVWSYTSYRSDRHYSRNQLSRFVRSHLQIH